MNKKCCSNNSFMVFPFFHYYFKFDQTELYKKKKILEKRSCAMYKLMNVKEIIRIKKRRILVGKRGWLAFC